MFGTSFKNLFSQNDLPDLDSLVQIKNRDYLRVLNCSEPKTNRTGNSSLPGRSGTSTVSGDSARDLENLTRTHDIGF